MSCSKNKKKFLFFEWFGPHHAVDTEIESLGEGDYKLHQRCAVCEVYLGYDFVSENYLVHRGYNVKKLQSLSKWKLEDAVILKESYKTAEELEEEFTHILESYEND